MTQDVKNRNAIAILVVDFIRLIDARKKAAKKGCNCQRNMLNRSCNSPDSLLIRTNAKSAMHKLKKKLKEGFSFNVGCLMYIKKNIIEIISRESSICLKSRDVSNVVPSIALCIAKSKNDTGSPTDWS